MIRFGLAIDQIRQAGVVGDRIRLVKDALDLLKREVSISCNMIVVSCKVENTKGNFYGLTKGLCRASLDLYASIRQSVNQSLIAVSKRPKEMCYGEGTMFQEGVHVALRTAVCVVQRLFVDAFEVVGRSLGLIVG